MVAEVRARARVRVRVWLGSVIRLIIRLLLAPVLRSLYNPNGYVVDRNRHCNRNPTVRAGITVTANNNRNPNRIPNRKRIPNK